MQEHYGLTDEAYKSLVGAGITTADFFHCMKYFDPDGTGEPIAPICLYKYIDRKGDFRAAPVKLKHKLIAKAVFECHFAAFSNKVAVFEYIEDLEDKEF